MIYSTIALMTLGTGPDDIIFLWVSPFFGMFLPMGWVTWRVTSRSFDLGQKKINPTSWSNDCWAPFRFPHFGKPGSDADAGNLI